MMRVEELPSIIDIGITGEMDFRHVEIDMTSMMAEIPDGVPALVCMRPGEETAYRPEVSFSDNILRWTVMEPDLGENEGMGYLQAEVAGGDAVAKSDKVRTRIHRGIKR